jgi:predicted Zn-dependent protease
MLNLKDALTHKPKDAEWAGFREVREVMRHRVARDGKPELSHTWDSHGVMAEVLVAGQFGYAATPDLSRSGLQLALEKASAQSRAAKNLALTRFDSRARPTVRGHYKGKVVQSLQSHSPAEVMNRLIELCNRMKVSPKIVRTEAFALATTTEVRFASSNGSEGEQFFDLITLDCSSTAQDAGVVQTRTSAGLRGLSFQGGWEHLFDPDMLQRADRAAQQSLELLTAEECPTGTMDLILMPDQMMLQIHESIGHPLELDRILGDERNYAGWSFVHVEDFGRLQYGSPIMNVTFDPTVEGEFASYAFDDHGRTATREFLIERGLLKRPLGGNESQLRAGIPGVANARASSWNRAPIDRMANINLEAGNSSLEEMIGSVERGVLMESNRSWSIDDFRNKFQFGCEYGKLIEKGKVTRTVRNPNYRGVTVPFWNNLKKVGNDTTVGTFGTPYCGKGEPNQAIRVGHRSPACLFSNVEVFGGA